MAMDDVRERRGVARWHGGVVCQQPCDDPLLSVGSVDGILGRRGMSLRG